MCLEVTDAPLRGHMIFPACAGGGDSVAAELRTHLPSRRPPPSPPHPRGAASLLAGGGAECVLNRGLGLSQSGRRSLCRVERGQRWRTAKLVVEI